MRGSVFTVGAAVLLATGVWIAGSAAQTAEGPFTAAQAAAGRTAYAASCAGCHQANLSGAGEQPPLAGAGFMASWGRRTAKELYDDIRAEMPYGKPGSLDAAVYQNIVAFILSANGAHAGAKPFDGSGDIRISAVATGQVPTDITKPVRRAAEDEGGGGKAPAMKLGQTLVGDIKTYKPVTDDMLVHPDPNDWLIYRGNYQAWSHSGLKQINDSNVGQLQLKCRANGIVMSSNVVGPIVAPIVFAAVAGAVGWRNAFYLVSVPGFIVAALVYVYLRDSPAEHPRVTQAELAELSVEPRSDERLRFMDLLRYRSLWQLFFVYMTWDVTWWGFQAWLPTYLYTARGFTLVKTGGVAALPFAAGFLGVLSSAYVSDRIGRRKAVLVTVLVGNGVFMLATALAQNVVVAVACLTITGFFLPAIQGPFWALAMDLLPARVTGYATGFINTGGQIAGVGAPIVIGALVERTHSFAAGFVFMALAAVTSAALVAGLQEPARAPR